ncbi:hypothetical protein [Streptococcus tangpeifui]|uniref:hypothetical protein n=1 Tax=Streptococcus tangpeifui TaxID=2709400 RepID=UPI0013EC2457|nr:hypothetical protein [Streptococcus sp. ZJ373]
MDTFGAIAGGATMAFLSLTGPVGWGVACAYLATSAVAGAMIGYGAATYGE